MLRAALESGVIFDSRDMSSRLISLEYGINFRFFINVICSLGFLEAYIYLSDSCNDYYVGVFEAVFASEEGCF